MFNDRRVAAFQEFIVASKAHWSGPMFRDLHDEYAQLAAGKTIATPEQVAELLADNTTYRYYAWFERHVQRFKYSSRWGLVAAYDAERQAIEARLAEADERPDLLTLDASVSIPDYYTAIDIHQHPGNLHGDSIAGPVYKASALSIHPGTTPRSLHERFVDVVDRQGSFRRILDMGCGFGKSTLPFAKRFAAARVTGIDLSEPCLRLAAVEAAEAQARNIHYRQMDARHTAFDDGAFDLVTSTMVLHEMPPEEVERTLAESYRLLQPGGVCIHLDFRARDPYLAFLHHTHGKRNNEPFIEPINRMDVEAAHRRAGFASIETLPFDERDNANAEPYAMWRLPWVAFIARKAA